MNDSSSPGGAAAWIDYPSAEMTQCHNLKLPHFSGVQCLFLCSQASVSLARHISHQPSMGWSTFHSSEEESQHVYCKLFVFTLVTTWLVLFFGTRCPYKRVHWEMKSVSPLKQTYSQRCWSSQPGPEAGVKSESRSAFHAPLTENTQAATFPTT